MGREEPSGMANYSPWFRERSLCLMEASCAIIDCMESNIPVQYCSDHFCWNGEAGIFTTQKRYVNSISLSYWSWDYLFKLLTSATLKLRIQHNCQEQNTTVSTSYFMGRLGGRRLSALLSDAERQKCRHLEQHVQQVPIMLPWPTRVSSLASHSGNLIRRSCPLHCVCTHEHMDTGA